MGPGATRNTASAALEAVLASIRTAVNNEHKVRIPHLGTFVQPSPESKLKFCPAKGFGGDLKSRPRQQSNN